MFIVKGIKKNHNKEEKFVGIAVCKEQNITTLDKGEITKVKFYVVYPVNGSTMSCMDEELEKVFKEIDFLPYDEKLEISNFSIGDILYCEYTNKIYSIIGIDKLKKEATIQTAGQSSQTILLIDIENLIHSNFFEFIPHKKNK